MRVAKVEFTGDGHRLVGDLYRPGGRGPHPAVVLTGPFSGVRGQVTGDYAERFASCGFVALSFDHRNWGDSDGGPRHHEDPTAKLADLRAAVGFLATRPGVDPMRVTACGVCLGAVYATRLAAVDPRVKGVALIAGAYPSPARVRERLGPEAHAAALARLAEIAQHESETGETQYWPVVHESGGPAGHPDPAAFGYFGTDRGARPGWENRCTALSALEKLALDVDAFLPLVTSPLLIVHGRGDRTVPLAEAESALAAVPAPKEIVVLGTAGHFDLYDDERYVRPAVELAASFFERYH